MKMKTCKMFQFLGRLYRCSIGSVIDSLYNDVDGVRVFRPAVGDQTPTPNEVKISPTSEDINEIPEIPEKPFRYNRRYLLPSFLYGLLFMDLLYRWLASKLSIWSTSPSNSVCEWTLTGNCTNDGTIARKLLPAVMGYHSDIFFLEVTAMAWGVAILFLFHNMAPFERKYRMIARVQEDGSLREMVQNEQALPKIEAESIFKLHLKAKKLSNILNIVCNGFTTPFYNLMIAINWTGSLADVKASLWITSTLWYFILNLYITILCFVFNCRYLRVRQQTQMSRLRELIAANNRVLVQSENGSRRVKRQAKLFFMSSWFQISAVNRQLNDLGLQIAGFNGFWSRYLTALNGGFTFLVAYMAFLILKLDQSQSENLIAVTFLCYFICFIFSLLLWITLECSDLVVNNKETLKLQRIFTVHTSLAGGIPRRAAIKFDHIEADSKSLGKVGFQLLDSLQINSKMFELLIVYISCIFMKCVQNEF